MAIGLGHIFTLFSRLYTACCQTVSHFHASPRIAWHG